jgi:hypothetical protein
MDTFTDLPPEEIKLLTAAFLGQTVLGELKQLDNNIVSGLARPNMDPYKVLGSIPTPPPQQPAASPPALTQQFIQHPAPQQVTPAVQQAPLQPVQQDLPVTTSDPNQLELNFNTSPYTISVFERLEKVEKLLKNIADTQADIIDTLSKKKTRL